MKYSRANKGTLLAIVLKAQIVFFSKRQRNSADLRRTKIEQNGPRSVPVACKQKDDHSDVK